MKYRRLDDDHDYCFERSFSDYLEDSVGNPEAIQQAIKTSLFLLMGEWWENTREGLPLWQKILGQRTNKKIIDNIIVSRIRELKLPNGNKAIINVSNVDSVYNSSTRSYSFSCIVDTAFGKLIVSNSNQDSKDSTARQATPVIPTWHGEPTITWQEEPIVWQG